MPVYKRVEDSLPRTNEIMPSSVGSLGVVFTVPLVFVVPTAGLRTQLEAMKHLEATFFIAGY